MNDQNKGEIIDFSKPEMKPATPVSNAPQPRPTPTPGVESPRSPEKKEDDGCLLGGIACFMLILVLVALLWNFLTAR